MAMTATVTVTATKEASTKRNTAIFTPYHPRHPSLIRKSIIMPPSNEIILLNHRTIEPQQLKVLDSTCTGIHTDAEDKKPLYLKLSTKQALLPMIQQQEEPTKRLIRQESEPIVGVTSSPKPPCCGNRRSISETVATGGRRRSIFGSFWESSSQKDGNSDLVKPKTVIQPSSPRLLQRQRTFGGAINEREVPHQLSFDSRPMNWNHIKESSCGWQLPAIPSPLQRLRRLSGGVYPLVKPKSILRNKGGMQFQQQKQQQQSGTDDSSFNLTRTVFNALRLSNDTTDTASNDTTDDDCDCYSAEVSSTSTNTKSFAVHFDPRVTVTELAETTPRIWYSEIDLERFKRETVEVAREYLRNHPEEIPAYSQAVLDPVTKRRRKKALYTMPALCDLTTEDEEAGLSPNTSPKQQKQQQTPLSLQRSPRSVMRQRKRSCCSDPDSTTVQHILIVDRNDSILDLFRRSLQNVFGDADIQCVKTAEEALTLMTDQQQHQRSFDIIIAEERLYLPPSPSSSSLEYFADKKNTTAAANISSVPDNTSRRSAGRLSGSELFSEIQQQQLLLIGVSMHPEADAACFEASGADFVWGKPPPRMDSELRDELVQALQAKRKGTHMTL